MEIKKKYIKPETENILLEAINVIASSIVVYEDEEHIVNGKGRSKQFWGDNDF